MKTKSSFFPVLIISLVIAALTLGYLFIYYGAKDIPYEQYKAQNNCPYEGNECPNAQQAMIDDEAELQSMSNYADSLIIQYKSAEYVIDSLSARIIQLETQLAGYEFSNHSKITKAGITRITRDERGLLSVEFKRGNKEYAFDYITDVEFQKEFGFAVK